MEIESWFIMDFSIPIISWSFSGKEIDLKQSILVPDSHHSSNFTCFISGASGTGTGVIVSKRDDPIIVKSQQVRHLVLTAGHVLGTQLTNLKPQRKLQVKFGADPETTVEYLAGIIHDYSDWDAQALLDPLTNQFYALPNDLGLLVIENCDLTDLHDISIADTIEKNELVTIVGYPQEPQEILYCAPFLRDKDLSEYTDKIKSAFLQFNCRVSSTGNALTEGNLNLGLTADYSSTSGQSGAPVYVERGDELKLVGINLGGAAIGHQRELGQVIGLIKKGDWTEGLKLYNVLVNDLQNTYGRNYCEIEYFVNVALGAIMRKLLISSIQALALLMNTLTTWHEDISVLNHNIAFPCYNPLMRKVSEVAEKFKALPPSSAFDSYLNLWSALNS